MKSPLQQQGFTLIELIVVLVIIGVLAVSLVPRFFSAAGSSEYTYRDQALAILYRSQMQAMHCSNAGLCDIPMLQFSSKQLGTTSGCLNNASHLCIGASESVSLSFPLSQLRFNSLGQPVDASLNPICTSGCTLQILGSATLSVCIESEGFIHSCG
ncbi:type II secretion system protein [Arsukibacterium sp.]|uniref:type II secretion system protein n=1 Tax=Arsukibacterium sp. TaxID=1977258 RepID=UPI002FD8EFED